MAFGAAKTKMQIYTVKVELLVSEQQAQYLDGQSKICNWARNYLVDTVNALMAELKSDANPPAPERAKEILTTIYSEGGIRNLLPLAKKDHPFLKLVHSSPLKNIGLNLGRGIKSHQKGRTSWIRHKKWKNHWTALEFDESGKGWKVLDFPNHKALRISFGELEDGSRLKETVKLANHKAALHKAIAVKIIRDLGKYHAVFTFKKSPLERRVVEENTLKIAYIDPNSSNFGHIVDNCGVSAEIQHMRDRIKSLSKCIDKVRSKRDRCKRKVKEVEYTRNDGSKHKHFEPSKRFKRLNDIVHKYYAKLREQKKQFSYSLAHKLAKTYDTVGIGNWVPDSVDHKRGRHYNSVFVNMGIHGQFKDILTEVFNKSGKSSYILDESGTTRTCSACGFVVQEGIPPNIKRWSCSKCGENHNRDENAAINGLQRLKQTLKFSHMSRLDQNSLEFCNWWFHPHKGWTETALNTWTTRKLNATVKSVAAAEIRLS